MGSKFGDSCKNLHTGFTVCELCGVKVEELVEAVTQDEEKGGKGKGKKGEKGAGEKKGPANVFAFLDSDSESESDSDGSSSEEEKDKEDEVVEQLAASTISGDMDDDDFHK